MIRGTTAQFRFKLPCNVDELDIARIFFGQSGNNGPSKSRPLPIIKRLNQCQCGERELTVVLNKEETLRFSDKFKAYTQIRYRTKAGLDFACKKKFFVVYPVEDDSVLDGDIIPTPEPEDIIILDGSIIV